MSMLGQVLFFLVALTAAALFAFLETAFTALRLFKLKELQMTVAKYKGLFTVWEANPQRILITILIANNFAHVLASVLISEIMQQYVGDWGLAIGVGIATIMILIFGEIIPKTFAKTHHERVFGSFLWLVYALFKITYPFVTVLLKISNGFFHVFGGQHILEKQDSTEEEIRFLIDYSDKKGVMDTKKTEMLQNILCLGQKIVKEIMVPKCDVTLLDINATVEQAVELMAESGYSRLPVYENSTENIVGLLHQKDLLRMFYTKQNKTIRDLILPITLVPETQKINQLLSELLKKQIHMVIVINEFGEFDGLVTLENIIEEIVGDITDEHEKTDTDIIPLDKGGWLINASIPLEELEDAFKINFPAEDSITLAGFLAEHLQHLPKKGERIIHEGYCFQVQQANARKVFQVLMFKHEPEEALVEEAED